MGEASSQRMSYLVGPAEDGGPAAFDQMEALRLLAERYRQLEAEMHQYKVSVDGSRTLEVFDDDRAIDVRFRASAEGSGVVKVTWYPCGIENVSRGGDPSWIEEPVAN